MSTSSDIYDVIIIGGGSAGSTAAKIAARDGRSVALVERDKLGGTCLNYGCDPTKSILDAAHSYARARHAERYGFRAEHVALKWSDVMARARQLIDDIRGGDPADAVARQEERGIDVVLGEASFEAPTRIRVGERRLQAERIIIASGARARIPEIDGLAEAGYVTNVEVLSKWEDVPERLAIIGGGVISVEFAQMLRRMGVEVTVFDHNPEILKHDEPELAGQLREQLTREGVRFALEAEVCQVSTEPMGKRLSYSCQCCEETTGTVMVDEILVAAGRQPNTESLNLAAAGVETNDRGLIVVSDTLATSAAGIFAAGDVTTSRYAFTHVAGPQGKLALRNAFADEPEAFNFSAIPHCTYTDPALAAVGEKEADLQAQGVAYRVGQLDFKDLPRAKTSGNTSGQVKILAGEDGRLLGVHILGEHAGDLLAPAVLAMREQLPVTALANVIFPYPTFSEAVRIAAAQASG